VSAQGESSGAREPGAARQPALDEELLLWLGDEPAEIRAADAMRVHEIAGEFARGFDALAQIGSAVSIFGDRAAAASALGARTG
jgi:hypothetical protein